MYVSMTSLVRYGGASCSTECVTIASNATATALQYGRRYPSSLRIRRLS